MKLIYENQMYFYFFYLFNVRILFSVYFIKKLIEICFEEFNSQEKKEEKTMVKITNAPLNSGVFFLCPVSLLYMTNLINPSNKIMKSCTF